MCRSAPEKGYDAVSLEGGYTRWLLERMEAEQKKEEEESGVKNFCGQEIEKKYPQKISKKTVLAICQGSSGI